MRWLSFDSIAGRIGLVLLIGLTLSHILSVALYFIDRNDALVSAGEEHIGERIATVVEIIEKAPRTDRPRLLEYFNAEDFEVNVGPHSTVSAEQARDWKAGVLKKALFSHFQRIGPREVKLRVTEPNPNSSPPQGNDRAYSIQPLAVVSVRIKTGDWLNFVAKIEALQPFWSHHFLISIFVMVTAVLGLSAVIVHFVVAPLGVFSRAAEQLGLDIQAPPLAEDGPREVREAAKTFNEMQRRIRKLIDDRTRMLAAISHDLRTPITRLRLRTDFIDSHEQQRKAIRDLDEMESMIASLISFARDDINDEPRETVDLSALISSICDDMADLGLKVSFASTDQIHYRCSRLAMRRAVTNLIENAIRYGNCARVTIFQSEENPVIQIDDDGPGIPEAEIQNAFDPFYRVEQSRNRETGGTGIGLYVAQTVIQAHGGDIHLTNRDEGGLRAEVALP